MEWITKEGNSIAVGEMTVSHIQNCLRMLVNKLKEYPGYQVYIGDSDAAEMAVDEENMRNDISLGETKEWIALFQEELKKRNI